MRPIRTVVWLSRRVSEVARDESGAHPMQNGPVKEQRISGTALCVAGNLHPIDCEIADSAEACGRFPHMKCCGNPFQDKAIGAPNVREVGMPIERQHNGIGETARSLQDGSSTADPSKNRDPVTFAGGEIDLIGQTRATAQHDEQAIALPKPEGRISSPLIQFLQ